MNGAMSLKAPSFDTATSAGEVLEKDGYHQPGSRRKNQCGCSLTTDKGAYRDVTVEMPDGRTVHFYHQSPVAVEWRGAVRVDSCGYQTTTTKERINRHLPAGYSVIQRDFTWYLTKPDGSREEFRDGMTVEP
jgi:hypothetical protein